jgi:hypothetical protein
MTTGPWHVNALRNCRIVGDGSNGVRYDALHVAGANRTVAKAYHLADARLIALAPELLAALRAWDEHTHGQGKCVECYAIEATMRALLARAEARP